MGLSEVGGVCWGVLWWVWALGMCWGGRWWVGWWGEWGGRVGVGVVGEMGVVLLRCLWLEEAGNRSLVRVEGMIYGDDI